MVSFGFISRFLVGLACLPVAVYVFTRRSTGCGRIFLAAGLLLIGVDSVANNIFSLIAVSATLTKTALGSDFIAVREILSAVSSFLTIVHWSLILTGIILISRKTAQIQDGPDIR